MLWLDPGIYISLFQVNAFLKYVQYVLGRSHIAVYLARHTESDKWLAKLIAGVWKS